MPAKKKAARFEKGTTDHDGDGKMGGSRKAGALTVLADDTIYDGEGGFLPKGAKFDAADDEAAETLKARGLAK